MTTARPDPAPLACDACGEPATRSNPVRAGMLLLTRFDSRGEPTEYRAPGHACRDCCLTVPRLLLPGR